METITTELFRLQDEKYRAFQIKLIPNIPEDTIIGVRTPELRRLAKSCDLEQLTRELPHRYFEENQLHAFAVSEIKDFSSCVTEVCRFLPYVDNWATCDQMTPKVFKKYRHELLPYIYSWLASGETYTLRFAVKMLMDHFLDEDFDTAHAEKVAGIHSDEYYVNMMRAWYFATALAKQYDAALPFLEENRLDNWTHNRTIQKSIESYRVPPERKDYLKTLRR